MNPELRTKKFNMIMDKYLMTGEMAADDYESLTKVQRTVIQVIKRSFNRIKSN